MLYLEVLQDAFFPVTVPFCPVLTVSRVLSGFLFGLFPSGENAQCSVQLLGCSAVHRRENVRVRSQGDDD